MRLYANLGLATYIELAESAVVRVVEAESATEPSTVFFRGDAEITTCRLRPCGLTTRCQPPPPQTGGGPIVDPCEWSCIERMRVCEAQSGSISRLWCYISYGSCRLGCLDPPIIAV